MAAGEDNDGGDPGFEGGAEPTKPDHLSDEGWEALPEADRKAIVSARQRYGALQKNFGALSSTVAELKGMVEGLKASNGNGNGHSKPPGQRQITDFSEDELNQFLAEARATRAKFSQKPEDEALARRMELLGDGGLEDEARIELATRRALNRTKPELDKARAETGKRDRAQALHNRILGIVGPEVMSGMLDSNGNLKKDHPVAAAAYDKATEMLGEQGIDPSNEAAVAVVLQLAFKDVMAERSRDGAGSRDAVRGRLENLGNGGASPRRDGTTAARISTLLRQGKVPEAHDLALKNYFAGGEMPDEFIVRQPI